MRDWLPVFIAEEPCQIVADSLNYCHDQKQLRINAFVIMPTHMHLVAFDGEFDSDRLSKTVAAFRRYTGHELTRYCQAHSPRGIALGLESSGRTDRQHHFWQQSRHPEAVMNRGFCEEKVAYLHDNPRRAALVRSAMHWRFSSAAYWVADPPGPSDVALSCVEW